MRSTGLWFSAHPLEVLVADEARRGAVPIASLRTPRSGAARDQTARPPAPDPPGARDPLPHARAAERVTIVGLRCAARRLETRQGGLMLFATLADQSGLAECMLLPDAYRAFADVMQASILRVEGRLDRTLDTLTIVVERAIALDAAALEPFADQRSRHGSQNHDMA